MWLINVQIPLHAEYLKYKSIEIMLSANKL